LKELLDDLIPAGYSYFIERFEDVGSVESFPVPEPTFELMLTIEWLIYSYWEFVRGFSLSESGEVSDLSGEDFAYLSGRPVSLFETFLRYEYDWAFRSRPLTFGSVVVTFDRDLTFDSSDTYFEASAEVIVG